MTRSVPVTPIPDMMFGRARFWVVLICAGLLAACAGPQPSSFDSQFERAGRFLVQVVEPAGKTESVQGGFRWRQNESGWQLDLISPLGATLARLDANASGVVLQRPGEMPRRAATAALLVSELFYAQVPVDAMSDWIRGRIVQASDVQSIERDAQNRVVSMSQAGWKIRFDRYDDHGPRLVEVTGVDQGRDVRMRMIVDGP